MIIQRFIGDQGTWQATLTITTSGQEPNSYAELESLQQELKLRANVTTQGSIITAPPVEDPQPEG